MPVKRNSWGRRCQLPLLVAVAVAAILAWSSYHHMHHKFNIEESHRSLSTLSDYIDPKSTSPHVMVDESSSSPSNGNDVNIHMYIKATGKRPWFDRAERTADTWGKELAAKNGNITFLFDNNNHAEVDEFSHQRPWITVKHVEGTDNQGGYKGEGVTDASRGAAWRAQRLKTRAVFTNYLGNPEKLANLVFANYLDNPEKPDWICYLDDDMIVNISNLKMDLLGKEPKCSPNCLIGDMQAYAGIKFTCGGWCMQQNLAQRAAELLHDKTDEELGWTYNDDVNFSDVLQRVLGAIVTDSDRWYSEYSLHPKRLKWGSKGIWRNKSQFRESIEHNLAVYHYGYAY